MKSILLPFRNAKLIKKMEIRTNAEDEVSNVVFTIESVSGLIKTHSFYNSDAFVYNVTFSLI